MAQNTKRAARLRSLVLTIGDSRFGDNLFDVVNGLALAEHCLVFRFRIGETPDCMLRAGQDGIDASVLSRRYVRGLYTMDANFPRVLALSPGDPPVVLSGGGAMSAVFRQRIVEPFGISDLMGIAIAAETESYYLLLLKTGEEMFSEADHAALAAEAEVISAAIAKHCYFRFSTKRARTIDLEALLDNVDFAEITGREKDMCHGILGGSSSDEIAAELGISINTVLTYRKRLYQRLCISSQHELFERVLQATVGDWRWAKVG